MPVEHEPGRPEWDCLGCGKPFPCDPAREHLTAELDEIELAHLAERWVYESCQDIPNMPADERFARFLAWTAPLR